MHWTYHPRRLSPLALVCGFCLPWLELWSWLLYPREAEESKRQIKARIPDESSSLSMRFFTKVAQILLTYFWLFLSSEEARMYSFVFFFQTWRLTVSNNKKNFLMHLFLMPTCFCYISISETSIQKPLFFIRIWSIFPKPKFILRMAYRAHYKNSLFVFFT